MDFANLVCKVNTPLCNECTLKNMCNFENKIENKKKKQTKIEKLVLVFLLIMKKVF